MPPVQTKMESQPLNREFYNRDTHSVAKELLGKLLVRTWRSRQIIVRITEVESYVGENDRACHASRGRTKRTEIMFGPPGHAYVYLIYGMYHCLNIVTEEENFPAAVLIRAGIPVQKTESTTRQQATPYSLLTTNYKLINGPGKLTRALHITRTHNKLDLTTNDKLYIIDDGFSVSDRDIQTSPRVNVDYAGPDALLPWRYFVTL